ncbi:hypothetical protein C2S53_015405 [Perilla frutescens var. hirtella]|uniref:Uncharacterized protein n=1 Tax=Perilla frutescens var. hirtella TaxID=608512 RepID=A0AAD4J5R5_PERFH|nr:hypothetical protein C2S53_015405 [Perilla frutescens var. hirtella]
MDKVGLAEDAVHELTNELRFSVTEEVRSKISSLETQLVNENEKFASLTTKIDKYRELQQDMERKFDLQYQRTIAEALDNHLTAVQRDHEHMSQLEERRIRDDMAREEAKRREKAIQEQMRRKEQSRRGGMSLCIAKLKADMAERAKAVAIKAPLKAEKKAAEEAAAKLASETLNTAHNAGKDSNKAAGPSSSTFDGKKGVQPSGFCLLFCK